MQQLQELRDNLKAIYTSLYQPPVMDGYAYRPPTAQPRGPGRPRYLLSSEQLAFLRGEFNSWTQIACDLGVSRQTIYNRRRQLGFSLELESFSHIQNSELDVIVEEELRAFPRTGETNVIAGFRQQGLYIQRWCVWETL